jgi:hypothetical protein
VENEKEKPAEHPYEYYFWTANTFAEAGMTDEAAKIIKIMLQKWPERVIAKGEPALDSNVTDLEL